MNTLIHLIIARQVRKVISRQTGMKLNQIGFGIGNILPDLDEKLLRISHYPHESRNEISQMALRVQVEPCLDRQNISYQDSLEIGIICHYVSDYFCHVHSIRFNKSLWHHYLYELKMLFHLKSPTRQFAEQHSPVIFRPDDIQPYLILQSMRYDRQNPKMTTDLRFAMATSADVAASMILGYRSITASRSVIELAVRLT